MTDIFNKAAFLADIEPALKPMRAETIWGDEGRVYLRASADFYGYEIDSNSNILLKNGSIMTPKHKDYNSIVSMAKKDASNGPLWRNL